jgi:hypothetical protein
MQSNKNVIGNALILHSRIKPRNEDKSSRHVYVDTPYMSGMVYASTFPPSGRDQLHNVVPVF